MAIEIEKKYRLNRADADRIREALRETGAANHGESFEENTIYRGGKLDKIGGVLRIRRTNGNAVFTFKKRVEGEHEAKTQIEHESEVGNPDEIAEILDQLGFKKRLIYEKRRETWKFRGVEIVFDELPFGSFMEFEGPLTAILEAEMLLDLEFLEVVRETYPRLTVENGVEVNGVFEARFN
jgi:adenylate cyclase class 2